VNHWIKELIMAPWFNESMIQRFNESVNHWLSESMIHWINASRNLWTNEFSKPHAPKVRRFLHFCSNFYVKSNSGYSLPTLSSKKSSDHRSFFCVCLVKRTRTTVSSSNSASNMPVFNQGPHQRKQTPDLGDPRRKTQGFASKSDWWFGTWLLFFHISGQIITTSLRPHWNHR